MKPKIYFRADGNSQIGLGHVIRSLALAEMLKDDFQCIFLIREPLISLEKQILDICEKIIKLPTPLNDIIEVEHIAINLLHEGEIVVLDGYHFTTDYQRIIKNKGCKLVCIDDIYAYHFVADVVINHAPGLLKSNYSVEEYTQLCLGLRYSLLRCPFLEAAKQQREISQISTLFMCFGGSDFNNVSTKALKSIYQDKELLFKKIHLVLGGANTYVDKVVEVARLIKDIEIVIHQNVSAERMVFLMQSSQLAIVPASSILYEIVAVKMPVITGYYVDNQVNIYRGFLMSNLVFGIENFNTFSNYGEVIKSIYKQGYTQMLSRQHKSQIGESKVNYIKLFTKLST